MDNFHTAIITILLLYACIWLQCNKLLYIIKILEKNKQGCISGRQGRNISKQYYFESWIIHVSNFCRTFVICELAAERRGRMYLFASKNIKIEWVNFDLTRSGIQELTQRLKSRWFWCNFWWIYLGCNKKNPLVSVWRRKISREGIQTNLISETLREKVYFFDEKQWCCGFLRDSG